MAFQDKQSKHARSKEKMAKIKARQQKQTRILERQTSIASTILYAEPKPRKRRRHSTKRPALHE